MSYPLCYAGSEIEHKNYMNTPHQSRIRPDDVLGNLSEEDQAQILTWLEEMTYAAAVRQIAQPRPEGLDIKTHVTSLRRFYERHESEGLLDSHAPSLWREPINQIISNPINFRPVLMQTLEREALLALNRMQDNPKLAIQLLDRLIPPQESRPEGTKGRPGRGRGGWLWSFS
jgi:hypothetical protein